MNSQIENENMGQQGANKGPVLNGHLVTNPEVTGPFSLGSIDNSSQVSGNSIAGTVPKIFTVFRSQVQWSAKK